MFATVEVLDRTKHAALRFTPVAGYRFAAELMVVPLSAAEVAEAAKHYAIVFPEEAPTLPHALLSLVPRRNAFVDADGGWTAAYIPAHIRRYPFILAPGNEPGSFIAAVDRAAPQFAGAEGEPLFTEAGEPGPTLARALDFLRAFQGEIEATRGLMQTVLDAGVLVPRRIEIAREGKKERVLQGFRAVDPEKFNALADATFLEWRRNGLLPLIYAHLNSLSNVQRLPGRPAATAPSPRGGGAKLRAGDGPNSVG